MYKRIKDNIQNINIVIGCKVGCNSCYARNNVKRFHTINNFNDPEFFPNKLKLLNRKEPHINLLTGMSDISGWQQEWIDEVFKHIKNNPHHQFLFLTKRPDLLHLETNLDNVWFGVTITSKNESWKIETLKNNVKAKHYHVTFEPLFDNPSNADLNGINWIVIGTMTGALSKKIKSEPEWVLQLTKQARDLNIPVFWKEDLEPIMGTDYIVQEFPKEFIEVLKEQKR